MSHQRASGFPGGGADLCGWGRELLRLADVADVFSVSGAGKARRRSPRRKRGRVALVWK